MEPIHIRELVAWVAALGLVVTLANSKMTAKQRSSKSSHKKASKPGVVTPIKEKSDASSLDAFKLQYESIPSDDKAGGPKTKGVAKLSREARLRRFERRRAAQVSMLPHPLKIMRNSKATKRDALAPHKRKK